MTTLCVLGDSIAAGRYAVPVTANYGAIMAARLGWSFVNAGVPGTSYLMAWTSDGSDPLWPAGTYGTYGTRLAADVIARNPDVVLVQGSSNDIDAGFTANQVVAAATAVYASLRAGLPSAWLIVTFPLFWQRNFGMLKAAADYAPYRAGMKAAADSAGAIWIDPMADNWITGTGSTNGPTGDGNADVYIWAGAHPVTAGHAYLGTRLAFAIRPPSTGLDY